MSTYIINGQSVSERDWNAFKESLVNEIPSSKACFDDNNVTKDEIVSVLDTDKNKKLTHEDLKGFNETQFGTLNNILKKHGFSIGTEAGNNIDTSRFDDAGSAPKYLLKDRYFVLTAVKKDGRILRHADPSFKIDREIVLAAVKQNGNALEYANVNVEDNKNTNPSVDLSEEAGKPTTEAYTDPSLTKDREIVLAAVKQSRFALRYADSSLKKDIEIVLTAVKKDGRALEYADPSLKKNGKIVLTAVKQDGRALQYADPSLKKNREIVLAAVKQNGRVLEYADPSLKKDIEIVLAAVKQDGGALQYADESLKKNEEIVLAAVRTTGWALQYADPSFKKNGRIVLTAVRQDGSALKCDDPSLKMDRDFILAAVKQNGRALKYTDESFKKDREIVLAAVRQDFWALEHADPSLKKDGDFVYAAAKANVNVLGETCISKNIRESVWKRVLEESNNFKGLNIPKSSLASYELFTKHIKEKYDIEFLTRFRSIDTLVEVLKTRDKPVDPNDKRPTAVVIFPKMDGNGAFKKYPTVDRLVELGYRVVYSEVSDEVQVERRLSEATDGGKRKADLIVLAGHGTSEALALGGSYLESGVMTDHETKYIDTSDFKNGWLDINLPKYLSSNGDLILDSCSNGEGGKENPKNLSNTIARIMPSGVQIQSSTVPMNIINIFKINGKLKMEWTEDSLYTTKGGDSENKLLNFLRSYFQ